MKFFVGDKEKEFFNQNGLLCQEEVFSDEEIDALRLAAEKQVFFGHKKDLAMKKGDVQDKLFSKKLGVIAFELAGKVPLRYGYDMFFRLSSPPKKLSSSLSPLKIGVCIPLCGKSGVGSEFADETQNALVVPRTIRAEDLPLRKGSVLFFSPESVFSILPSLSDEDPSFLLLLYAGEQAQYTYQADDPFTHDLKKFGYVFGDKVKNATNPFLYR